MNTYANWKELRLEQTKKSNAADGHTACWDVYLYLKWRSFRWNTCSHYLFFLCFCVVTTFVPRCLHLSWKSLWHLWPLQGMFWNDFCIFYKWVPRVLRRYDACNETSLSFRRSTSSVCTGATAALQPQQRQQPGSTATPAAPSSSASTEWTALSSKACMGCWRRGPPSQTSTATRWPTAPSPC